MTFEEAIALQPEWVQIWLNVLLAGAFLLPLLLLIWRPTRLAGLLTVASSAAAGFGVTWLYGQMGYVRLLGLPHILLWTPVLIYLAVLLRRPGIGPAPRLVLALVAATIAVSLVFDYVDFARYLLGERAPMPGTAPAGSG